MPWLNDWVFDVATDQKQPLLREDYSVLKNRNISKEEHLFLINRISTQLTLISEILSFFGCLDAAQKIEEAVDELAKIEKKKMPVIRRSKTNATSKKSSAKAKSGAEIFELHESGSS